MNHAPGAEEAKRLLMPVGDQDEIVSAAKLQLIGPGNNWEAYITAQKEAAEARRRVKQNRKSRP